MADEVLLTISTLQGDEEAPLETRANARYYQREGIHYLLFEERLEGFASSFQSRLKIKKQHIELKRRGAATIHMIFEEGKRHLTRYATPYGELHLEICTRKVEVEEKEEGLFVMVEYTMETDGALLNEYQIRIAATKKASD